MYIPTVSTATIRTFQQVFIAPDGGNQADLRIGVDYADLTGALGGFPDHAVKGHQLRGDIVHHKA
jgi:hypothetical protein